MNQVKTLNEILATEFSPEFVKLMQNRMVVSFYKYGLLVEGFPHKVDAVGSLMLRLRQYTDTGNREFLVDVANYAMIEFMLPRHPSAFFQATDVESSPGRRHTRAGIVDSKANDEIGRSAYSTLVKP